MKPRILVVDDEDTIRSVITEVLLDDGYEVTGAASAEEALDAFRGDSFQLVLTDIVMKKMSGIELLQEVKAINPEVMVVVMTSHASIDTATAALRSGAQDYLTKPFEDLDSITNVVEKAIQQKQANDQKRKMVAELQDMNRDLHEKAIRDGLTGLYNRRHFGEALETELRRSQRHNHVFSLVFVDVDHFKKYNDTHGHLAGDELLKTLARLLKENMRATTLVCRYGGEEFVLLLPETPKDGAVMLADKIRARVEGHPFEGRHTQPGGVVTLSLGVATFPMDAADSTSLIAEADQALYAAKNAGRNRVCVAGSQELTTGS